MNQETEKIKILVVEDDPHVSKQYDIGLPGQIFHKQFAKDGREALSGYKEMKPDIILLDIMLPIRNGFEVLKNIRTRLKDQSTPIIMATGLSGKDDVQNCLKFGISGYIVKPIKPKEIAAIVLDALKKAKKTIVR